MSKSFTIHDLPKDERPRERLVKFGEQALSAQELLQLILGRGIAGESVAVTAQKLLTQFGSLQKLAEASIEELSSIFVYIDDEKERQKEIREKLESEGLDPDKEKQHPNKLENVGVL